MLVPGANPLIAAVREPWMPQNMSNLSFAEVWHGPVTTSVLTYTLTLDNLPAPLIFDVGPGGTCDAGDTCVLAGIGFSVPTTFTPVSGTLTVHFNDEIETFNFHYLSNVPEPVTLVLVGTGLVGIGWQKYRAKKSFPA